MTAHKRLVLGLLALLSPLGGCGSSASHPVDGSSSTDLSANAADGGAQPNADLAGQPAMDLAGSVAIDLAGGTETLGGYAGLNLQTHAVYAIDLAQQDYPTFLRQGATSTYEAAGGWDGGPSVKLTPPSAEGYGALGSFNSLWLNGTFTIRKLNFRFEMQLGPTFAVNWPNNDLKFIIVHTADTLGGDINERPMCNLANASAAGSGILAWAVGAGTVKNFNPPGLPPAYSPNGNEDFYFGPANGTHAGKPVLGPANWVSVEVEIIAEATAAHPNGLIRAVLWSRTGAQPLTDLQIPWNYDSNWSLPRFISEVQVLGGYYNTGTISSGPDNYYRIANRITFAANRPGLLGPRVGFRQ